MPCLLSTFSPLIHTTSYLKFHGDTTEKIMQLVAYSRNPDNRSPFFKNTNRIRKQDPVVRNRNERSAQTSHLSPVFLSRLNLIVDGHHASLFYTVVDIFTLGLGNINTEFLAFSF